MASGHGIYDSVSNTVRGAYNRGKAGSELGAGIVVLLHLYCPHQLRTLATALRQLDDLPVVVVVVRIDPHEGRTSLRRFLDRFDASFIGLVGDAERSTVHRSRPG